jgi:predicted phage-related endonuclease
MSLYKETGNPRNMVIKDEKINKRIEKYYENHDPDDAEKAADEITTVIVAIMFNRVDLEFFKEIREDVYQKVLKETKKRLVNKMLKKEEI